MKKIRITRKQATKILQVSFVTIDSYCKELEKMPERYGNAVIRGKTVQIDLFALLDFVGNYKKIYSNEPLPQYHPEIIAMELVLN